MVCLVGFYPPMGYQFFLWTVKVTNESIVRQSSGQWRQAGGGPRSGYRKVTRRRSRTGRAACCSRVSISDRAEGSVLKWCCSEPSCLSVKQCGINWLRWPEPLHLCVGTTRREQASSPPDPNSAPNSDPSSAHSLAPNSAPTSAPTSPPCSTPSSAPSSFPSSAPSSTVITFSSYYLLLS